MTIFYFHPKFKACAIYLKIWTMTLFKDVWRNVKEF